MKNKTILIVISLLVTPFFVNAYYSDEQFRMDIMDSIRNDNLRQQQQDIIDSSNRDYQRLLDSLKSTNSAGSACSYPIPLGATDFSTCDGYQNTCDKYDAQMAIINSRTGSIYTKPSCDKAISCKEEVANYNKRMNIYNGCVKTEKERLLQDYQTKNDERERAWQKEETVMIKELELIRKENELKKREEALGKPTGSGIDLDKILKEVDEEMKTRKLEDTTGTNNVSNISQDAPLYDQYLKETQASKNKKLIQPTPQKRKSLESIFSDNPENTAPVAITPEPPKSQTRFEHFKQSSVTTIKKVASWLNPVSWFKKKVTTPEVISQKDYSYEAFLKDQANK